MYGCESRSYDQLEMAECPTSAVDSDREENLGSGLDPEEDYSIRKKSSGKKDENRSLRQEQVQAYRSKVSKEERARRSKLRHADPMLSDSESPRKKKKVSFLTTDKVGDTEA